MLQAFAECRLPRRVREREWQARPAAGNRGRAARQQGGETFNHENAQGYEQCRCEQPQEKIGDDHVIAG